MTAWWHDLLASRLWVPLLLLLLAAVGAGARRAGMRRGREDGMREAPIALRARCMETGVCPICGTGRALNTPFAASTEPPRGSPPQAGVLRADPPDPPACAASFPAPLPLDGAGGIVYNRRDAPAARRRVEATPT